MKLNFLNASIVVFILMGLVSCSSNKEMRNRAMRMLEEPRSLDEVKKYALGEWESIHVELRPTENRPHQLQIPLIRI